MKNIIKALHGVFRKILLCSSILSNLLLATMKFFLPDLFLDVNPDKKRMQKIRIKMKTELQF